MAYMTFTANTAGLTWADTNVYLSRQGERMSRKCDDATDQVRHAAHYWDNYRGIENWCPGYQGEKEVVDTLQLSYSAVKARGGYRGQVLVGAQVIYETEVVKEVTDDSGEVTKSAQTNALDTAKEKAVEVLSNLFA